jgi:PKHD-type hydroxylase
MNLIDHYWFFKDAIPHRVCDNIIKYGISQKEKLALTGKFTKEKKDLDKKQIKDLKKVRDSNIVWMDDPWIYKEIHPYIKEANKQAGWNFQWDASESCQFTKYKKNQYYDWHIDAWDRPYEQGQYKGKIRKLSVSISLSDSSEYKGGELEFCFKNESPNKKEKIRKCEEILSKGSLVVFPSFILHRVKPVTKGTRYSLVIWNIGDPYK